MEDMRGTQHKMTQTHVLKNIVFYVYQKSAHFPISLTENKGQTEISEMNE